MPYSEVFENLQRLQAVRGKAKEELLDELIDDDTMQWVVKAALNPYRVYGVGKKSMDSIKGAFPLQELPEAIPLPELLRKLETLKLTGHDALKAVQSWITTYEGEHNYEVLRRILLKDLRCGVSSKTVEKVRPGLVPIYDCQLSHKYSEDRIDKMNKVLRKTTGDPTAEVELAGEPKYDGVRGNVWDCARTRSRNGLPLSAVDHLARQLSNEFMEWVVDAEAVSGHFQDVVGSVRRKGKDAEDVTLVCFDIVPKANFLAQETYSVPLKLRRQILKDMLDRLGNDRIVLSPQTPLRGHSEIMNYYLDQQEAGEEGAIIKDVNAPYEFKRSYGWLKLKDVDGDMGTRTVDLEVIRVEDGESGKAYEGIVGSLICDYNGKEIRVSSGLTMEQRRHWKLYPGEIVGTVQEIAYHEETRDGALRHGRLVRPRPDKRIEDGPGV